MKAASHIFLLLVATMLVLLAHMMLLASSRPVERRIQVHAHGWPDHAPSVRLVLLSDFHVSRPGDSVARLTETVARVNALHPDLVLLAGDFLSTGAIGVRAADIDTATAPLGRLRARFGMVAVLGNHDQGARAPLLARLEGMGITTLENEAVRRGPLAILGFGDYTTGHLDVTKALAAYRPIGGWPVLLSHTPYVIWSLPKGGGLLLAGHTHCGQISLPIIGAPMTPPDLKRYDCGLVRDGSRLSIVSAGLGISILPLRLHVPPDYWVIDLKR